MKEKLLKIVNYYGIRKQTKYLMTEIYELIEAVVEKEESRTNPIKNAVDVLNRCFSNDYKDNYKNHICEEIADCYVLLEQIRNYYNITNNELKKQIDFKITRQVDRIEKEEIEKRISDLEKVVD